MTVDVASLTDLERAADALFPAGRLPPGDGVLAEETVRESQLVGGLYTASVSEPGAEVLVGFAAATIEDGAGYLHQMAVSPDWGGRGIGRRLLEAELAWARASGVRSMTLTTFADIPWNARFYASAGFVDTIPEPGSALACHLAEERALGMTHRVAMVHDLRVSN